VDEMDGQAKIVGRLASAPVAGTPMVIFANKDLAVRLMASDGRQRIIAYEKVFPGKGVL